MIILNKRNKKTLQKILVLLIICNSYFCCLFKHRKVPIFTLTQYLDYAPRSLGCSLSCVISLHPDNDDHHHHHFIGGVGEDRTVVRYFDTRAGIPIRSPPLQTFLLLFIFTLLLFSSSVCPS